MRSARAARLALGLALGASLLAAGARADESRIRLAAAPGSDLVQARCAICHSLDYIQMNSPFLARTGWEAEVRKMIKVMGAPIAEPEVAPIVDYLTAHYGVQ
jgi:hypothetical protein